MRLTFEQRSSLPVSACEVWSRATTPEGINDELFPWLRMSVPAAMRGKTIDQLPLEQRLGRSWLLAMCGTTSRVRCHAISWRWRSATFCTRANSGYTTPMYGESHPFLATSRCG